MGARDDPLDFEEDDPLIAVSASRSTAKRRKVIELDELLNDYCREKSRLDAAATDKSKNRPRVSKKGGESDDEEEKARQNERIFCKFVNSVEKQVNEMETGDEVAQWGLKIFGLQKNLRTPDNVQIGNCHLLGRFSDAELLSDVDLSSQQGNEFLESMLMNGWLLKLVLSCGYVDDSIASWMLQTMLYSSDNRLWTSSCNFWCTVLLSRNESDQLTVELGWFPTFSLLNDAMLQYGYLYGASAVDCAISRDDCADAQDEGPPENIIAWLRVVSACCHFRNFRSIFSTLEAEQLLVMVVFLYLERSLQGVSFVLSECLQSLVGYFDKDEWDSSCRNIAETIACRIPKDLNCLRVIECVDVADNRRMHFRSKLALQLLTNAFGLGAEVADGDLILKSLASINVKDKCCNFFRLYIYLVLAENMLLPDRSSGNKSGVLHLWSNYLQICSTQIASTDWRSYASKVRNKASYSLQNTYLKG